MSMGVYWIGRDGNVWSKGSDGLVVNNGSMAAMPADEKQILTEIYSQIDDPVNPSGGGGGGGTVDTTAAARAATQKSIDSLDTVLGNGLSDITKRYQNILAGYGEEEALNAKTYNDQVNQNEQTRTDTRQQALLAGAQGGQGLRATLASLNALGGTGALLANRAIAQTVNKDIGEGDKVFSNNATQLDNANNAMVADQKKRRQEADDARVGEEQALRKSVAANKQSLFEKMAGYFSDIGNTGAAGDYISRAGSLAPEIASYTRAQVTPYTPRNIGFEGGQLQKYLAGANDMTVKLADGGNGGQSLNNPLYALTKKRDQQVA